MPSTRKLPSGRHQARFRDRDGKVKAVPGGTYTHERAALSAAVKHEEKVRTGPRMADHKLTWGQWCDTWWPTRTVSAATRTRDQGRLERYVLPQWRKVALVDVTRHEIRTWVAKLTAQELSAATIQRIVHLFSASLSGAVDAELIAANPAAGLKLQPARTNLERYLSWEEWEAIAGELQGPHLAMATFLVMTGVRWGEAAGLHWNRVDLERRTVTIVEAIDDVHRVIVPRTKGKKAREVPLPRAVLEVLPPRADAKSCDLPHEEGICRSPLVLTSTTGTAWDASNFRRVFYRAARLAGVEHVRVHDLRHTTASWLVQNNTPLQKVQAVLGHASPVVTARYAHLAPGAHDDVLNVLDSMRATDRATRQLVGPRIERSDKLG